MNDALTHGTFNYVDLTAKDLGRARAFYEPLFGWTYQEQETHGGPPYGLFLKGGKAAAGVSQMQQAMIDSNVPPTWNTYVLVDDIKTTEDAVKANGGHLMFDTIDIPGAGKTNWVKDPEGAIFALWQATGSPGGEVFNQHGGLSWNERATRDMAGMKAFYAALFGWTYTDGDSPSGTSMAMIKNAQGREMGHLLAMTADWGDVPPSWSNYFTVDRHLDTIEQAKALGGTLIMGPVEIEPGWFALVADPDGGMFYVFEDKQKQS